MRFILEVVTVLNINGILCFFADLTKISREFDYISPGKSAEAIPKGASNV